MKEAKPKRGYIIYNFIYINCKKCKVFYNNRKQLSGCLGAGIEEGRNYKRVQKTFVDIDR